MKNKTETRSVVLLYSVDLGHKVSHYNGCVNLIAMMIVYGKRF